MRTYLAHDGKSSCIGKCEWLLGKDYYFFLIKMLFLYSWTYREKYFAIFRKVVENSHGFLCEELLIFFLLLVRPTLCEVPDTSNYRILFEDIIPYHGVKSSLQDELKFPSQTQAKYCIQQLEVLSLITFIQRRSMKLCSDHLHFSIAEKRFF